MMDFNDQVVEALLSESCQDPFIIKLRATIDSIDGNNQDEVSAIVDELLASRITSTKPMTMDQLLHRMATTSTVPSQIKQLDALSELMGNSSMEQRQPSRIQRAAYGHGPREGFAPDPRSPYYHPDIRFDRANQHIVDVFHQALNEVNRWEVVFSADFIRKAKSPAHPIRCVRRDIFHILQFLSNGRPGWSLIELPINFYDDLLPIVTEFVNRTDGLRNKASCKMLKDIVCFAHQIGLTLDAIRMSRFEAEIKSREDYFKQMEERRKKQVDSDLSSMQEVMGKMGFAEKPPTVEGTLEALYLGAPAIQDDDDEEFTRALQEALDEED